MSRAYKKALKKDAKMAKKQGINYEVTYDKSSGEVHKVQPYIGANKKISSKRVKEINDYIDKQSKRKYRAMVGTAAGTTTIAVGASFASAYLRR